MAIEYRYLRALTDGATYELLAGVSGDPTPVATRTVTGSGSGAGSMGILNADTTSKSVAFLSTGGLTIGVPDRGDVWAQWYKDGVLIDTFGDPNGDATADGWSYYDGWAYRKDTASLDGTFKTCEWKFSGDGALSPYSTNDEATADGVGFPIYSFTLSVSQMD